MHTQQLTARFPTGDEMNAALADLRRSGAVCHTGAIPYDGLGPSPVSVFGARSGPLSGEGHHTACLTDEFSQGKKAEGAPQTLQSA